MKKGFTIFFAMLVSSLALAIGLAIFDLTYRELDLSATVTQSVYAIYAADTGAECALYWDLNCPLGGCRSRSAFATSTQFISQGSGIMCNGQDISSTWSVASNATMTTTTFSIIFAPTATSSCATVEVGKTLSPLQTTIISHGYNTCTSGYLQLERTLQVSY